MSSHYRLGKYQIFTAGAMTGTSVITSKIVRILMLDNVFLQLNISGTPTGTFSIQVSSDHVEDELGNVIVAGNWVQMSTLSAAGSAVILGSDLNQLGATYLRVVYTNASGTGVVNGFVSGKGLM